MLVYGAITGTLSLILAAWALYYQRESVRLMKASAVSPRQRAAMAEKSWWKNRTTIAMAVLLLLTWVPFTYGLITKKPAFPDAPVGNYNWGTLTDGEIYYSLPIADTKPDRKLILAALHYNGLGDIKDAKGLQKSQPYDYVRGVATLVVDPDQNFRNEAAMGRRQVTFVLLDVPKNLSPDQFSTLRQAMDLGANWLSQRIAY